jgi:hypothetical protein
MQASCDILQFCGLGAHGWGLIMDGDDEKRAGFGLKRGRRAKRKERVLILKGKDSVVTGKSVPLPVRVVA